jgi:hypothetical protein
MKSLIEQLLWENSNYEVDKIIMRKQVEPLRGLVRYFKDNFPYDKEFTRHDVEDLFSEYSIHVISRLLFILQKQAIIRKTSWAKYVRIKEVAPICVKVK